LIFDDELGAASKPGNSAEGIEGHANVWADAEYGLFWDGFGDAGVDLPGDVMRSLGQVKSENEMN